MWQDLTGGPRRALRRVLKRRTTTNVVAEFGPEDAAHTLVVHAHHDAARTSFIFDQTLREVRGGEAAGRDGADRTAGRR